MQRGRPVEILLDVAVENIRTTARRLNRTALSEVDYTRHGSFSASTITKRWRWSYLCELAGIRYGRQKKPRKPCAKCCKITTQSLCRNCKRKIARRA